MKVKLLLILFFLFLLNESNAQESSPAKLYLEHYFDMYVPIQKDMWAFSIAVARDKEYDVIENKRIELLKTLNHYQAIVNHSPNFENDSTYRLSVSNWMVICQTLFQKKYIEILKLKPKAKNSFESMKKYIQLKEYSNLILQKANEELDNSSQKFANQNSIQIIEKETRIGGRIKKINNTFKYYDMIYLLFFEAYINEAKFNVAVNSQNVDSVKHEIERLTIVSKKSLTNLDQIVDFEKDPSLKLAATKILNSYIATASLYGEQVLTFFKLDSDFKKCKKEVIAKSPQERTQEDIDKYNNLVLKRKEMIPIFNQNTQLFNHNRRKELDEWNTAAEEFIGNHAL